MTHAGHHTMLVRICPDHIEIERCGQSAIRHDTVADAVIDFVSILLGNVEGVDTQATRSEICRRLADRPGDYDRLLGVLTEAGYSMGAVR